METADRLDALIVGAGPTGLVLALWMTRLGARVRVIDKTSEPGTTSRAVAVQARTLELYRQIGLADAVVREGRRLEAANMWVHGRRVAHLSFGAMGEGISPFPYGLIYPQDEHERLLIEWLAQAGVSVERRTELVGFEQVDEGVRARIRCLDGNDETCQASYVIGCDGAHSIVRETLGIGFPGGTYEHLFYVADVDASGPTINGEVHVSIEPADFLVIFPMKREGHARVIGTIRSEAAPSRELTWDDVSQQAMAQTGIRVDRVAWFSTYHVHHRVANAFRRGRAFLAGDAAHIHSPVGGQGMNTGIGDAVNLAWKLAAVVQGRAAPEILDSYEAERIPFAQRLVETTDRVFTAVTSSTTLARFIRMELAPRALPAFTAVRRVRRLMFRTISQTAINYRGSGLSEGRAGRVEAGDRLPWVERADAGGDNFVPLTSLDWQVHVYGDAPSELRSICESRTLALHVFPWQQGSEAAGLARDAVYLVRPDGYVALAATTDGSMALARYLDSRRIVARA
jgi:2-polyprenyl-6-methoxyphenol hydroxylase-like FAD-dependent oxidoreductase